MRFGKLFLIFKNIDVIYNELFQVPSSWTTVSAANVPNIVCLLLVCPCWAQAFESLPWMCLFVTQGPGHAIAKEITNCPRLTKTYTLSNRFMIFLGNITYLHKKFSFSIPSIITFWKTWRRQRCYHNVKNYLKKTLDSHVLGNQNTVTRLLLCLLAWMNKTG